MQPWNPSHTESNVSVLSQPESALSAGILLCRPEEAECFSVSELIIFCGYFWRPEGGLLFFSISFANEISECLTEFWLLVLFLMSLQLSLLQDDSHCFLNAYVWMPIVGSLATASRWKPRLAEARLMLNLSFSSQEKGHCCELMTEQCSEMFDYPALYLCLLPPTVFSFPGHSDIFLLCYLLSFKWDFAALTVVDWDSTGTSTEPLLLDTSSSF